METSPPADSGDSIFKRFLQFIGLFRTPDTAEDIEQEIHDILEEGEEQGLITPQEGQMISSIFELKETIAREIMTPRTEMVCAPDTATIGELIKIITEKGFTRIPIYTETLDNIIGTIHAKDLLQDCALRTTELDIKQLIKPAYFALESTKIVELLKDFQTEKIHMAIITDEFGSVRGLVTLEDVLEEIVGEITDEYDKSHKRWMAIDSNTLLLDAKVDLEEVEEYFGVELPEGPYESVGGLIIHQFERVPEAGAMVEVNSLMFHVVSADKRRIKTVKIQKKESGSKK